MNLKKVLKISFLFCLLNLAACAGMKSFLAEVKPPEKEKVFFKLLWAHDLNPVYDSGNLPIALQSPYVFDGIVYVGDNSGHMNAYELENGRLVWRVQDKSSYHSRPVVYKELLIYGTVEGRVIARKLKTGEEVVYNVDLGAPVETGGSVHNGKILFQLRNHQIFCLDVETGKIIWGFKKAISYSTTLQKSSTPIVFQNKVFVGFADGTLVALSLEEGLLVYETKLSQASKFLDVDSNPFLFDGKIIIAPSTTSVVLIEPSTGKIIKKAEFQSLRAPIVIDGKLYFGTNEGEIVSTDKNLNILSRKKISDSPITSIAFFKNAIVGGNLKGELVGFDLKELKELKKFSLGHQYSSIFADIVSIEGHLVLLSSRNKIYTF